MDWLILMKISKDLHILRGWSLLTLGIFCHQHVSVSIHQVKYLHLNNGLALICMQIFLVTRGLTLVLERMWWCWGGDRQTAQPPLSGQAWYKRFLSCYWWPWITFFCIIASSYGHIWNRWWLNHILSGKGSRSLRHRICSLTTFLMRRDANWSLFKLNWMARKCKAALISEAKPEHVYISIWTYTTWSLYKNIYCIIEWWDKCSVYMKKFECVNLTCTVKSFGWSIGLDKSFIL